MSEVDIDRRRGLRSPETTTPITMDWRRARYVLGGPGRNRTTDTRIFNLRVVPTRTSPVCPAKVLRLPSNLTLIVADITQRQTRRRIARRFCLPITYFSTSIAVVQTGKSAQWTGYGAAGSGAGGRGIFPTQWIHHRHIVLQEASRRPAKDNPEAVLDATRHDLHAQRALAPKPILKSFVAEQIVRSSEPP